MPDYLKTNHGNVLLGRVTTIKLSDKYLFFYFWQSFYQISGVTGGPVVAVFSIGMFTKIANKKVCLVCTLFLPF